MRLLIDSLIALMLVGTLAGVLQYHRMKEHELEKYQLVNRALASLYEQAQYRGALGETTTTDVGFPVMISPTWFDPQKLPVNVMLTDSHPWLDIAPESDMKDHPPDPIISDREQAGFWYNPNRGVFRARVPMQLSEQETLRLYNRVNGSALLALPRDGNEERKPVPVPLRQAEQMAQEEETGDKHERTSSAGGSVTTVQDTAAESKEKQDRTRDQTGSFSPSKPKPPEERPRL